MKKPTKYAKTTGKASEKNKLNSIDKALQSANIGNYNLIKVSSILPKKTKPEPKLTKKPPGTLTPTILSIKTSSEQNKHISAAIAIGEGNELKVVSESTKYGKKQETEKDSREKAKKMLKNREQEIVSIKSFSIQKKVKNTTTVLAAILLGGLKETNEV